MQGLFNLGFTCAINSLIQIICKNDLMRNIVLNCDLGDDTLISNLKEVIILMCINNKAISVLNYQLEDVLITDFRFEEMVSVRNRCTFLNVIVYGNGIYLPYSEYSILIRGALFV